MHLLQEKDLEEICGGCGKKHGCNFDSEWDEHSPFLHYKTIICEDCGYKISFKTIESSGI
ncbi:MAG: hypothetical protein KJ583_02320 [Nanoarchaeota archaeon]|nr:hypothetical protein [Nanoarchaeota archaeon]MBU1269752.1 hypothetical protein [Nanoarchaeota archaeon]MBU1604130.1 hypothetical protein [Nanoarchaeota archaeon]MBU2443923.1 hypothetical protein [Nanoarchaeota archaeon]